MSLIIALAAAAFERIFGYPQALVRLIGHPVIWMGFLIAKGEAAFNVPDWTAPVRRRMGILVLVLVLAITFACAMALTYGLRTLAFGWVIEAVLASSLLAQKGLRDAVLAVSTPLRVGDIAGARQAVSQIVGRDTAQLDTAEISRAAIETLAENASDGVVAPLFYLALFGLPGAALYKAINTADSMIGHRSERYEAFGWAAARLDDVANFIPARLTGMLFAGLAALLPGAAPREGFAAMLRDAPSHASPNAGWPEAAMAGALGFGLGGPRAYKGERLDLPQMGQGRRDLEARDIELAVELYDRLIGALLAALAVLSILWLAAQF